MPKIPAPLVNALVMLVVAGARDVIVAVLRKTGDVAVERARKTPDETDDEWAAVFDVALDALAEAVRNGDPAMISKANAVLKALAR